ncbi:ig(immunoglobulin) and lrr(leucine rich repeat) domain [Holotrichia oblita]|uniref:Ig(Immunoglobulin) and lrr(Leucine rich repeat) domain n=1 Tax=Holotrichia oblita TaxID=644536 RepID=A0ACB9TAA1_HOLOL|nr:ig(immunoglobulin) and lrr(leucine rich repeat) domain [Holotrichia oblita]
MTGRRLSSCCQELVSRLLMYFEQEKENGAPLLTVDAVHERVANASGISMGTVYNLKLKNKATPTVTPSSTATVLCKPRAMPKSRDVSEKIKIVVGNVIYEMYKGKKHLTANSLQEVLEHRNILQTSSTSLRRLLHLLGFRFKKDDNRRALVEKNDIAVLLFSFLRKYQTILTCSLQRDIVFLDETWIFSKGSQTKSWQDGNIKSVRKPEGYDGKRFIVLHAGTRNSFIANVNLIFSSKSSKNYYHG